MDDGQESVMLDNDPAKVAAATEAAARAVGGNLPLMLSVGATLVTSVLLNLLRPAGDRKALTDQELAQADSVLHEVMREMRRGLAEFPNEHTREGSLSQGSAS